MILQGNGIGKESLSVGLFFGENLSWGKTALEGP